MKHIRYIFPATQDFREERPRICWEHMYGWIDGYGALFDPAVLCITDTLPEWENGHARNAGETDFVITTCRQASELFDVSAAPTGIYVRPPPGADAGGADRVSEKERLVTPVGECYYPHGLPYNRLRHGIEGWTIGGGAAVARQGNALVVGFDMFSMLEAQRGDWPARRLTEAANMICALLCETGAWSGADAGSTFSADQERLRLDFQAYGINRLLVQWFLQRKGADRAAVAGADDRVLEALKAWQNNDIGLAENQLRAAFERLTELRRVHSSLDLCFLEFPHLGLLLEDIGFFELEWPEQARATLVSYLHDIRDHQYRLNLEGGASCWRNLATRFPELADAVTHAWSRGVLELTNGTFSLPLALCSPLALQYWQLRCGQQTFKTVFGKAPSIYQCQESSFSSQMPELLCHFGYSGALHIAQNRGQPPGDAADIILWQSPAGHGIPALTARDPALARKGNNTFLDLPLVHDRYGVEDLCLSYPNCMDLGYVPFRVQMVRAHRYAPVWGRFVTASTQLSDLSRGDAMPARSFTADDYHQSEHFFYPGKTNANALSHHEIIFSRVARWRQAQLHAWFTGTTNHEEICSVASQLCLLEAHDMSLVQDTRRGQFHSGQSMVTPPCTEDRLMDEIPKITTSIDSSLAAIHADALNGREPTGLLNASGSTLAFARIASGPAWTGAGAIARQGRQYAVGPFPAWRTRTPHPVRAQWQEQALPLAHGAWQAAIGDDGCLRLGRDAGRSIRLRPVDTAHGPLALRQASVSCCGPLAVVNLVFANHAEFIQTVVLDVLFTPESRYAEINVRYAPGREFDAGVKWDDYLAIEAAFDEPLADVWRFNPNVRAETREDKVISPYCLEATTADERSIALLNEGAFCYELDRSARTIRWLFHVACENVRQRRMAVTFDAGNAFQLSRAWGQGLAPVGHAKRQFPIPHEGWQNISVESLVDDETFLLSNLDACPRRLTFAADAGVRIRGLTGESLPLVDENGADTTWQLNPFELAWMHVG